MYKAILVAVDGSTISDRALREGLGLARDQQAELRIVNIVDTMPTVIDFEARHPAGCLASLTVTTPGCYTFANSALAAAIGGTWRWKSVICW